MWKLCSVLVVASCTLFVLTAGVSPPKDCKPKCGKNEEYSDCANANCRPKNCSQVGFPDLPCPKVDPCDCEGGCICKEGFVEGEDGKCISATKCSSCGGDKNAISGPGTHCNQLCSEIGKPTHPCILVILPNACDCREGFRFDENTGKCVYPNQCSPNCTKKHEVPSNCVNGICAPRNCSQVGFPVPCDPVEPCDCIGGCVCEGDYVYGPKGTCIPRKDCGSCGGDCNAVAGCGSCVKTCLDLESSEPKICPKICYPNACDCKDGLVLDTSTNKCIDPKDCVTCGGDPNAQPGCDKKGTRRCPGAKPDKCPCPEKGSCMCKKNFYYDTNVGKCVRLDECSSSC